MTPMAISLGHPKRPIRSSGDDKLDREQFIRRLGTALINPGTKKSTGIVIGITGPWGSGKSSILNLLREHIRTEYEEAIVVPFDPWLVSGRNDLISAFMVELLGTINAERDLRKKLTKAVTKYGAHLAHPLGRCLPDGVAAAAPLWAAAQSFAKRAPEAVRRAIEASDDLPDAQLGRKRPVPRPA